MQFILPLMHVETHLACGWLLANILPQSTRRERLLIVLASIASDADGLSHLAGASAYSDWHHTVGHNLLAAAVLSIAFAVIGRGRVERRMLVGVFSLAAFTSHLVGDYFLSAWPLPLLAPFSDRQFAHRPAIHLDDPINIALSYAGIIFMAASLWIWQRTVLEFAWPSLDRLLARMAAPRRHTCGQCGRPTAITCDCCGQAVCLRHAGMTRRAAVRCHDCATAASLSRR